MKKPLYITLPFLLFCIIITGCKRTHCPAFPKSIADVYFPYTENEILNYINSNGDTLTFKIKSHHLTESYSFGSNCKCDCSPAGAFFRTENNHYFLAINGNIDLYDDNCSNLLIEINDGYDYTDYFNFRIDGVNPYISDNVRLFGDTVNMSANEDNRRFTDLQIITEKGVTRFFDREQDCEWMLAEEVK